MFWLFRLYDRTFVPLLRLPLSGNLWTPSRLIWQSSILGTFQSPYRETVLLRPTTWIKIKRMLSRPSQTWTCSLFTPRKRKGLLQTLRKEWYDRMERILFSKYLVMLKVQYDCNKGQMIWVCLIWMRRVWCIRFDLIVVLPRYGRTGWYAYNWKKGGFYSRVYHSGILWILLSIASSRLIWQSVRPLLLLSRRSDLKSVWGVERKDKEMGRDNSPE